MVDENEIILHVNNSLVQLTIEDDCKMLACLNTLAFAVELGCNAYILQVIHPDRLFTVIHEVLRYATNRQNPRILLLPNGATIKNILSKKSDHFEFSTISWISGQHQILKTCSIKNCDISKINLFPDKLTDLQGKELRLATMDYSPYSILRPNGVVDGIEVRIFKEFVRMYNASWSIVTDDKQWGYIFPNGTSEGILGAVADDRADVGCAAVFMWYDPHLFLEYTAPYIRSGVTCLVPRAKKLPQWLLARLPFSVPTWILLVISLFMSTAVMYTFHRVAHILVREHQKLTIGDYAVKTIGLLTSQTISRNHFRPPYRQLLTWFHMYFFLISLYYSTGLASVLTIPRYEKQINTVEDLIESGLEWGATHNIWVFSILRAQNNLKTLKSRFVTLTFDELKARSTKRNFAYAIERLPGGNLAIGDYVTEEAINELVVMNSDLYYEYCGLALHKGSPYLENMNSMIRSLSNAGIIYYWESEVSHLYLSAKIQMGVNKEIHDKLVASTPVTLKLIHLNGAFVLLIIGLATSIFVFLVEILVFKCKNIRYIHKM
ncbi:putative glutamate receptor [Lycorma delicatula]|uniref:putative glutamate receptor n=1 Tax=Lycorma delicatula TaxID=130591 RepID=UPI003F511596